MNRATPAEPTKTALANSRREFLKAAGAASVASRLGAAAMADTNRPNVLFLISDDLDCRIRCFGDPIAITPNLDRLAARGVRFDRAYCQFPLCNPTRSSVLSGRYPTTTGVLDNNTYLVLDEGQKTLPDFFRQSGYSVSEFGKIFHGPNRGLRRGESKPPEQPGRPASAWFTPEERARQQAEDPGLWSRTHSPYRNLKLPDPAQYAWANVYGPLPSGDPGPDAIPADKAIEVLQKAAGARDPFFLAVGFTRPHVPLTAPKQYFDMYSAEAMPLPADFDTEPRPLETMPRDEFRENADLFAGRPFTAQEAREALRAYYACTTYMDAQLGRVLDTLDSTGLSKNTVIVFWGDHGWHLSEKGMWAKGTLFEASARAPLFIVDPRKRTAGQASRRVVEFVDIYPTLLDLCGFPRAPWLEGTSLKPLLDNPGARWDKPAYTVQVRDWFVGRSVRTERWRYTEWDEGRRGAALFDHDRDPNEMRNLARNPELAPVVQELRSLLRKGPVAINPSTLGTIRR